MSEWEDGYFCDKTLTHDGGETLYKAHLVNLGKYKKAFGDEVLDRLGK